MIINYVELVLALFGLLAMCCMIIAELQKMEAGKERTLWQLSIMLGGLGLALSLVLK